MNDLQKLRKHLKPGKVYRRSELVKFSKSVDRHLRNLVESGELKKLWGGVYYCPRTCEFGELPAKTRAVVSTFLKDDDYLLTSLTFFNNLRLGTTQIYNEYLVYNHKRNGKIKLNGRNFHFLKGRKFPKEVTDEYMLVDMVNNSNLLAVSINLLKRPISERAHAMGKDKILRMADKYGKVSTKKYFERVFANEAAADVK